MAIVLRTLTLRIVTMLLMALGCLASTQVDVTVARKLPVFRPLRRVIRNFIDDRQAFITIVFQRSTIMPKMRWFRQVASGGLPDAEFADMINIDGDQRYRLRMISSNDVTAVTLVIQPLVVESFPVKFVTCFSYNDDPFQYQLDTIIEHPVERRNDTLDGIVWLHAPLPNITFSAELVIHCAVRLESESSTFTDELNVYRTYVDRKRFKNGTYSVPHLMSPGCGEIHKDKDSFTEDGGGKYILQGRRFTSAPAKRINVNYEVTFKVLNGSHEDIGVYTCAAQRLRDRTYISSWAIPPHTSIPVMLFLPCDSSAAQTSFNMGSSQLHYQVRFIAGQPNCVRCRVYDRRINRILLKRSNNELIDRSNSYLQLDEHLNVADGGLSELTLTFLNPTTHGSENGRYKCTAQGVAGVSVEFSIKVDATRQ